MRRGVEAGATPRPRRPRRPRLTVTRVPGRTVAGAAAALLLALGASLGALPAATPVAADCVAPPRIEQAVLLGDIVFVGTVTRLENDDRWATVRVEERWRGADDLAETVAVHGGPEPGAASSIDRTFAPRTRYLFVVTDGGSFLVDNACSSTVAWTDDLARLRPAGVAPAAGPPGPTLLDVLDSGDFVVVAGLVGALLVAIVAYILILRSRRRPPDWLR